MTKIERTACRAAELLCGHSPTDAWRFAAVEVYGAASTVVRKVCPREAFLGLCEAGLLSGKHQRQAPIDSGQNRRYAVIAIGILKGTPELARAPKADLWRRVMTVAGSNADKAHNGQLDVVLGLWNAGLVN